MTERSKQTKIIFFWTKKNSKKKKVKPSSLLENFIEMDQKNAQNIRTHFLEILQQMNGQFCSGNILIIT